MVSVFNRKKLIYFLKNVCVPQVMDVMPVYDTSTDLENERIAVCNLLAEIDPSNRDGYLDEVKDIIIRQNALKGILHIEQSKIFVDEEAIRRTAELSLRETYQRYRVFGGYDPAEAEEVELALRKAVAGDRDAFLRLEVEANEKNSILAQLLIQLRDDYVSGPDHSLDVYLSTRIRHGTFAAQLRSPLETHNLITQRDKMSGEYKHNDYWRKRLLIPEEVFETAANQRLAKFSRLFDELIQNILTTWIQVRTSDDGVGLFDFRLIPAHAKLIGRFLNRETPFEAFVETVFALFRQLLLENVTALRAKFSSEVVDSVDFLLNTLDADIAGLVEGRGTADFSLAVANAKADLHRTIARVADWFRPPTSTTYPPFTFSDPVRIAIELMKRVYRKADFDAHINNMATATLRGQALTAFVDVFMIVFENAVKHSGLTATPPVQIEMQYISGLITILVKNEVSPSIISQEAVAKLEAIRSALERRESRDAVRKEGGTGFHKIQKIISNDLNAKGSLSFGFVGPSSFEVGIVLHPGRLIASNENPVSRG